MERVKKKERKRIHIARNDIMRLKEMIGIVREVSEGHEPVLRKLERKLDRVQPCRAEDISDRVVTMNTVFRGAFLNTGRESVFWLGFPYAIDHDGKKLSVLTPMGVALLGSRLGTVIKWKTRTGYGRLIVKDIIYQPEASKDYHL